MKHSFILTVILSFLTLQFTLAEEKLPFEMPKIIVPTFKTDTFDIAQFGAVGNGKILNTEAFAKAIEKCAANGGGVVKVPNGIWLTGPIVLRSNVNLYIQQGAIVLFSPDRSLYSLEFTNWEGLDTWRCQSPLSAEKAENIAITGNGVIDGSGQAWRHIKKGKFTETEWRDYVSSGGIVNKKGDVWYPSESAFAGSLLSKKQMDSIRPIREAMEKIHDFLRPNMVKLVECKNLLIDGPVFRNSPAWTVHPLFCEHITIRNVRIEAPWNAQNGDALDLESCRIGSVTNCVFDAGDDAICIKSGRDAEGRKRGKPTELFVFTDNLVYHGHGGFVIGSEMSGGARNLYVARNTFIGTDIGLRFKSTRGRGGVVENIWIKDINMINIGADAISFNMYYGGNAPMPESLDEEKPDFIIEEEAKPFDESTPVFRNFYIENINCNGAERGILINGIPESPMTNIQLKNVSIVSKKGLALVNSKDIVIENTDIVVSKGVGAFVMNCKNVDLKSYTSSGYIGSLIKIDGNKTEEIVLPAEVSKNPSIMYVTDKVNKEKYKK